MIPTIPPEPVFWKGLVHGDNFQTSMKIEEADIYKVVGEVSVVPNCGEGDAAEAHVGCFDSGTERAATGGESAAFV